MGSGIVLVNSIMWQYLLLQLRLHYCIYYKIPYPVRSPIQVQDMAISIIVTFDVEVRLVLCLDMEYVRQW